MAPVCAVVVAGGSGQRFGNPGGKQLVNVAGRPLMSWSIRAFDRSDKVGHIVVVCPAERRAEVRRLAREILAQGNRYTAVFTQERRGATRCPKRIPGGPSRPPGFFVRVASRYLREIFRAQPPPGALLPARPRPAGPPTAPRPQSRAA